MFEKSCLFFSRLKIWNNDAKIIFHDAVVQQTAVHLLSVADLPLVNVRHLGSRLVQTDVVLWLCQMPLIIVFNLRLSEEFANTERQNTGLTNMMIETSFVETMVKSLLGANNENGKIITVFFLFQYIKERKVRQCSLKLQIVRWNRFVIFFCQFWSEDNLFCPMPIMRYFLRCSTQFGHLLWIFSTKMICNILKSWWWFAQNNQERGPEAQGQRVTGNCRGINDMLR